MLRVMAKMGYGDDFVKWNDFVKWVIKRFVSGCSSLSSFFLLVIMTHKQQQKQQQQHFFYFCRKQARPNDVIQHLGDSRITATLQAMIQLEENGGELPDETPEATCQAPPTKQTTPPTAVSAAASPSPSPSPYIEEVKQPQVTKEATPDAPAPPPPPPPSAEEESKQLKEAGNAAYKKKNFDEALRLYEAAFEKDVTNMSILSNIAAVHFEKGDLDACIAKCHEVFFFSLT